MGGKSSSSSSSSNTTQQYDQRVGASDSGIAVGSGGFLQITTTDGGAVEEATKLIKEGQAASLDFADKQTTKVTDTAKESIEALGRNTDLLFGAVERLNTNDNTQLSEAAMRLILPVALGYVLVKGLK
jgi:hypothetical protein